MQEKGVMKGREKRKRKEKWKARRNQDHTILKRI